MSSSSSVQAARERLGAQLREVRKAARLSGRQLARQAGWADATTVSKIENGRRAITEDHIRLWCEICGASASARDELLIEQRQVASMWQAFREAAHQYGVNPTQKILIGDRYERLSVERNYQSKLVPGLLQTEGYMAGILRQVRAERHLTVDDVAEAVAERMGRQRWLRVADKRFLYVVEEAVLYVRPSGVEAQGDQLRHLLGTTRLPSVWFGVIPMGGDRAGTRPRESFEIIDDERVTIELLSGYLSLTHADEVATYHEAWGHLADAAVSGPAARELIRRALDALPDAG